MAGGGLSCINLHACAASKQALTSCHRYGIMMASLQHRYGIVKEPTQRLQGYKL